MTEGKGKGGLKFADFGRRFEESATATDEIIMAVRSLEEVIRNTTDEQAKEKLSIIADKITKATFTVVSSSSTAATGIASLVPPMCAAAIAGGCDGLLLEVHPDPSKALSDGAQSITPRAFAEVMHQCRSVARALGRRLN